MSAINWLRVSGENGFFLEKCILVNPLIHPLIPVKTLIGHVVSRALTKGHVTTVDTVIKMAYGVAAA